MRIQHNIMAMNAYRNYNTNTSALSKNLEKLSSGYKINRAGDDAAGLAISEKMRAQITGLSAAQKNVKDGISLVKTAEGAMQEIQDMLNRMDYLATQSANGTYDDDVDRANLQKEVDQLLSEINRIADSSNFNGTKLLDGKLGLNDTAFSFDSVAATEASDGKINITDLVAKSDAGKPSVHLEGDSATAATPTAKINLGDLKVNVAANTTATVTFNIAGKDYEVKLKNTSTTAAKEFTTAEIGTELVKVLNSDVEKATGAAGTNDAMKIGDAVFTAAGTTEITLTYQGTKTDGTTYKAETTFSGNEAAANAINSSLGFDVKVKTVADGTQTGDVLHKATDVEQAKAAKVAEKAGIDIKLNSTLIDHGGKLTIDGKTFVFKTDATKTVSGGTTIDVSSATTDEERIHMAADLLSKEAKFGGTDGREWKIGVNGDGTTIHIDQVKDSATGKKLDTYSKLIGVISANGKATEAANLGTKITVTDSAVKEGDTLTIDGKVYVFADKSTTEIPEGAKKVAITGGAGKNLANAISGSEYKEDDKAVIVRAAKKDAAAPMVTGKGLQLQIGDTSDSYNQLQVKIGDMHAKALGIKGLSISNPEDAAKAIQTIKNAINTVSSVRGDLGATQNRLEHTSNNLSVMKENIQDAESTIRDTDVAEEMMAYTKNNILVQSAQAMLAQANAVPQGVLQLLG